MRAVATLAALAVLALTGSARAQAAHDPGDEASDAHLTECVDAALGLIRQQGSTAWGEARASFLLEGGSDTEVVELPSDGCFGFFAVGHRRVQDLDIALFTETGLALERDVAVDAHPYVRYCGARGLRLAVVVNMYKGRGEYRLVRLANAPARLPDLNRAVGHCFAEDAGVTIPMADVGPEPGSADAPGTLAALGRELEALGYRAQGEVMTGRLPQRQGDARNVRLAAGRCYAIAAAGGPGVGDLDLFVRAPGSETVERDVARDRDAVVRVCSEDDAEHMVQVRMYEGEGDWALRVFALEEPPANVRPPGLEGSARIPFAEIVARMRARGMQARPLAWGALWPGAALSMPLSLEAGRCYAIGGVPSDDLARGDLDLVLLDDGGRLVAWEIARNATPLVFACPSRTATYRVVGRVYGAIGQYLVVVGESTPAAGGQP